MNFSQTRLSYYSDFALVPLLVLLCAPYGTWAWAPVGYMLWTFSEYAMHRWIFHRAMRAQHWIHHIRPTGYVAVSGLQSAAIHVVLMLGAFLVGPPLDALGAAVGLFIGYELGYLFYIIVHDNIHHGRPLMMAPVSRFGDWLLWRRRLHDVHHRGVEANFGVVHSWWDKALRTYCVPREAEAWLKMQRQQRQNAP